MVLPRKPNQECQNTNKTSRDLLTLSFGGETTTQKNYQPHESEVIYFELDMPTKSPCHLTSFLFHWGTHQSWFEPEAFGNKMLDPCDSSSSSVVCFSKWFLVGEKNITCVNLMLNVKIISYHESFPAPTFRVKRLNVNI